MKVTLRGQSVITEPNCKLQECTRVNAVFFLFFLVFFFWFVSGDLNFAGYFISLSDVSLNFLQALFSTAA